MPNYITAAIPKVKNTAASIRGYCNPVSRGSLTLPIGGVMRSVTSAQLGAAVERAALSLQDRTNQCREDVEELERAAAMRPAMRQAHQVLAAAIASRCLPADPAHWTRDIIVKFREAMTPEERALNLPHTLLDAERPVLATIGGLGTREIAAITDDAVSQIPFAISPPHTQVADRDELDRVMADKDDAEHKLQTATAALDAEKKARADAEKIAETTHAEVTQLVARLNDKDTMLETEPRTGRGLAAVIQQQLLGQDDLKDQIRALDERWQARQQMKEEQLLLEAEKSKTAIRRVEDECEQLRRDLETANQQLAKSQETLADAEEVRLRALNLAAQVGELTIETARLEVDLRKSEARANDKNDTCMELRARLNAVESNLTQAEKELKTSAIRQKAADGEVVRLKGRCDHLYSELYKRLNRDVAAVRSAPEDVDNILCASQTMASRITGLSIVSLPDDIWKAIDEGLGGLPIPNLPIQPERWTFRSSIKSSSPAMPTVHAACMALILASRSPAAPQEPMLANMCTLLSLGNPATTQLVELALRGISYRDTQMDSGGGLVWLVTVAARLASIDIGPMVDGLRQPFRRLVEMSGQHPVTAAGLRYICTNAGALDREAGLGFLEGLTPLFWWSSGTG